MGTPMIIRLLLMLMWTGTAFAADSLYANASPFVKFTSINRYEVDTTDFDRVDDVRTFTSEALFSESSLRLDRPLTKDELSDIARTNNHLNP